MASDLKCSHMVSHLVLHSGWSWVGILAQDDDHGWKEVCTTKAILVFLCNSSFHLVLQGLLGSAVLGQVWVSQDTLHSVLALAIPGISQVLQGSFSLMPQPSQLLHHLWNVHFKTPHWKEIVFDANGDIVTEFDILHGQKTPRTYSCLSTLAPLTTSLFRGQSHHPLDKGVAPAQVPSSVSSKSCTPGFSQIPNQGTPHCCFERRPCPE
ncbi:uncharacterized protein ACIGJ3_017745 [Trichechus inunguis]